MDMLSTAMNIFGGYYESDRGWRHYRVEGNLMMFSSMPEH